MITKKQKAVFDFIKQYVKENGFSPTFDEIALHFRYRSKGTVYKYIRILMQNGLVHQRWNRTRAMDITAVDNPSQNYLPLKGEWKANQILWKEPPFDYMNTPAETVRNNFGFLIAVKDNSLLSEHIRAGDIMIVQSKTTQVVSGKIIVEQRNKKSALKTKPKLSNKDKTVGQITGIYRRF